MADSMTGYRVWGWLALGIVIVGNAAGNVLLKLGANSVRERPALLGFINWQTVAGAACFALGLVAYTWALRQFQLHNAQIIVSLQYVVAIWAAGWLLGEHIGMTQWIGIVLIAAGLWICAS